jgi:hypothetical protein
VARRRRRAIPAVSVQWVFSAVVTSIWRTSLSILVALNRFTHGLFCRKAGVRLGQRGEEQSLLIPFHNQD